MKIENKDGVVTVKYAGTTVTLSKHPDGIKIGTNENNEILIDPNCILIAHQQESRAIGLGEEDAILRSVLLAYE